MIVFLLILGLLAGFIYVGLNWATGSGRDAGIGSGPTAQVVAAPSPAPAASPARSPSQAPSPPPADTYRVQAGDNFASIARQLGISLTELLAANPDANPQTLQPGQEIKLPPR